MHVHGWVTEDVVLRERRSHLARRAAHLSLSNHYFEEPSRSHQEVSVTMKNGALILAAICLGTAPSLVYSRSATDYERKLEIARRGSVRGLMVNNNFGSSSFNPGT